MIKYKIQSVLFDKTKWTKKSSLQWLLKHNYKFIKCHETDHYYRYRQEDPEQLKKEGFTDYRNIKQSNDVVLVVAYRHH